MNHSHLQISPARQKILKHWLLLCLVFSCFANCWGCTYKLRLIFLSTLGCRCTHCTPGYILSRTASLSRTSGTSSETENNSTRIIACHRRYDLPHGVWGAGAAVQSPIAPSGPDLLSAGPCSEKNVGALQLGRQTLFFLEKTGDLFLVITVCQLSLLLKNLRPIFCSSLSFSLGGRPFSRMRKNYRSFCGGPFLWGPLFGRTCWIMLNPPLRPVGFFIY